MPIPAPPSPAGGRHRSRPSSTAPPRTIRAAASAISRSSRSARSPPTRPACASTAGRRRAIPSPRSKASSRATASRRRPRRCRSRAVRWAFSATSSVAISRLCRSAIPIATGCPTWRSASTMRSSPTIARNDGVGSCRAALPNPIRRRAMHGQDGARRSSRPSSPAPRPKPIDRRTRPPNGGSNSAAATMSIGFAGCSTTSSRAISTRRISPGVFWHPAPPGSTPSRFIAACGT